MLSKKIIIFASDFKFVMQTDMSQNNVMNIMNNLFFCYFLIVLFVFCPYKMFQIQGQNNKLWEYLHF